MSKINDTPTESGAEDKRTLGQRLDARLAEIDSGIQALEERGKKLKEGASESAREHLASLQESRKALVARMGELKGSGSEALADLKEGVDSSWDEIRKGARELSAGVSKALSRFRDDDEDKA